jgi:hypothetical protein
MRGCAEAMIEQLKVANKNMSDQTHGHQENVGS